MIVLIETFICHSALEKCEWRHDLDLYPASAKIAPPVLWFHHSNRRMLVHFVGSNLMNLITMRLFTLLWMQNLVYSL